MTAEERLARLWLVEGKTVREVADELEISKSAAHRLIKRFRWDGHKGDTTLYASLYRDYEYDDQAPMLRPIEVKIPKRTTAKISSADQVSVHWGDTHFPFQDQASINVLYEITSRLEPDTIVCHGDVADMWQISDHRPPVETSLKPHQISLQDTLQQSAEHLAQMASLAKNGAEKYFLEGNHEERWTRLLADIQRNPKLRHLLFIPAISEVLTMPYLIGTDKMGYSYAPYYSGGDKIVLKDRLLIMHGYKATMWASRATLSDYGKSVIFGHTHRIQSFTKRDLVGTIAAWNMGCLCDLDPSWRQHTNWAHGFTVVTWKKIDGEWFFNTEQIRIHDGKALWRDNLIKG